ncbi:hypothetical protein [Stenotrophomonas maltophilia]|uniref:hypothetical protein n=1 Tax=Stenotrophomonas maltophilia TaxID=40324 RepID=UPI0040542625
MANATPFLFADPCASPFLWYGYFYIHKKGGSMRNLCLSAIAGALLLSAGCSSQPSEEVYVRDLETGKVIAIVQADDLPIRAGDKVFLTGRGSKSRVVPIEGQR